jgi:hypothetical protein
VTLVSTRHSPPAIPIAPPQIPAASRIIRRRRACSSALSNIFAAVTPVARSFPRADPSERPRRCEARRRTGSAAGKLPPRCGREERMKGPRQARMPVYRRGQNAPAAPRKTQNGSGFMRHSPPGNSHCTPTVSRKTGDWKRPPPARSQRAAGRSKRAEGAAGAAPAATASNASPSTSATTRASIIWISCRCNMKRSRPSRRIAMEGDDGG